jgi:hypothetical protein
MLERALGQLSLLGEGGNRRNLDAVSVSTVLGYNAKHHRSICMRDGVIC